MLTAKEIRESFKDFFASKHHQIVPSAPMVIKDDPTLMFTNAGMNQFKDIILGNAPAKYKRVADSQKCLRVSGKHNDLERWDWIRIIIRCSRCWETGRSVIISRKRLSIGRGNIWSMF